MDDELETLRVFGFTKIMDGTVGLFECTTCGALCARNGMSQHDYWHEEVHRKLQPEYYD